MRTHPGRPTHSVGRRLHSLMLGLALSVAPAIAAAQSSSAPEPPSINTRGEATVKRAPDQAWVTFAAEARAPKAADAQRRAAEEMTSLQAALKSAGVAAEAIRTTGYSLQPDVEYVAGASRVKGYIVRNQIEVRVDAIDRVSAVLDAAGGAGATSISSLRFDLKDRATVEREALRLAVRDAMTRAEAIAAGAGKTLGPILRIEEQGTPPIVVQTGVMRMAERAEATPITPGETEVRASVTLVVSIR